MKRQPILSRRPPSWSAFEPFRTEQPIGANWQDYLNIYPEITTDFLPGSVIKVYDMPALVRGTKIKTAIILDDPDNPFEPGITYAVCVWMPDYYPFVGPSWLKIKAWPAKAFPPAREAKIRYWIQSLGWIPYHFPRAFLEALPDILKIMDDQTWTGFKYVPQTRQKIYYHKRVGYRMIAPRIGNIQQRILQARWYFYFMMGVRYSMFKRLIYEELDPERWQPFRQLIKRHPWHRPTRGGIWYASGRPGDPTDDVSVQENYYRHFRYKRYAPGPPDPETLRRTLETKSRPYALDIEDAQPDQEPQRALKSQSPFHLPKFTDDDWEKKHEEYVKKHGYQIRLPGWDDIIHLKLPPKTTKEDYLEYKEARRQGRKPNLHPEIIEYFDKRRQRYLAYLATPQPRWYRSYASILTALDDAQDALSSAVLLGKIAIRSAPRALARFVGPLSFLMTATDLINLANKTMRAPWTPRRAKRRVWDMVRENPFANLTSFKDPGRLFDKTNWAAHAIEFLQVTDNLLGIGLCLGPIFSTPADAIFGGIKALSGEPVSIYLPGQDKPALVINAAKNLSTAHAAAITNPILTDQDRAMLLLSICLSANVLRPHLKGIHDSDRLQDSRQLLVTAPRPRKPDTIDLLQEAGLDPEKHSNLPLVDVKEALWDEWATDIYARITTSNDLHLTTMQNPELAHLAAILTFHATLSIFTPLTRPGSIQLQLRPDVHTLIRALHRGIRPNPEIQRHYIDTDLFNTFRAVNNRLTVPKGTTIAAYISPQRPYWTTELDTRYAQPDALTTQQVALIEQQASWDRIIEKAEEA